MDVTPIQKISEGLNGNTFYMKREDLLPFSFGGNKARKAALFFDDINRKGSDCIVTYGSSSSNHCRIIANMAAAKGIKCHIITPIESSHITSNTKMIFLFNSTITQCAVSEVSIVIERKLSELKALGYNPYFIQGGGHGDIGTHAYVQAYEEIVEYERSNHIFFDYIFHTSGTGTTQAGLVCGKLIDGHLREIVGISNARKKGYGGKIVHDSINSYLKRIGKEAVNEEVVNFADDYILEGYGSYNFGILQTIKELFMRDGIPLDPIYTGKGYWGMKEYIKKHKISGKRILFIHTGGIPLFFDALEELKNG
jgi:D-cysteine desulfhydrase